MLYPSLQQIGFSIFPFIVTSRVLLLGDMIFKPISLPTDLLAAHLYKKLLLGSALRSRYQWTIHFCFLQNHALPAVIRFETSTGQHVWWPFYTLFNNCTVDCGKKQDIAYELDGYWKPSLQCWCCQLETRCLIFHLPPRLMVKWGLNAWKNYPAFILKRGIWCWYRYDVYVRPGAAIFPTVVEVHCRKAASGVVVSPVGEARNRAQRQSVEPLQNDSVF
jgi:hypothetical protein